MEDKRDSGGTGSIRSAVIERVLRWSPLGLLALHYLTRIVIAYRDSESPMLEPISWGLWCLAPLMISIWLVAYGKQIRRPVEWLSYSLFWIVYLAGLFYLSRTSHMVSEHKKLGERYERQHDYAKALQEYRWLVEARWYRIFGVREPLKPLLFSLAHTACEAGDFNLARRCYGRIIADEQDNGCDRRWATNDLMDLEYGLKVARAYGQWIAGEKNAFKGVFRIADEDKDTREEIDQLYDAARIIRYNLRCEAQAKEVYRTIIGMDVADICKENARKWLAELEKTSPMVLLETKDVIDSSLVGVIPALRYGL